MNRPDFKKDSLDLLKKSEEISGQIEEELDIERFDSRRDISYGRSCPDTVRGLVIKKMKDRLKDLRETD